MEFKRIEVVKIVREARRWDDSEASKKLFDQLLKYPTFFSIRTNKLGPYHDCSVISTEQEGACLMSRRPRARFTVLYSEIELVEVECNSDILNYNGEEGRWENIIVGESI